MTLSIGLLGLGAIGTVMASYWRQHRLYVLGRSPQSPTMATPPLERTLQYGPDIRASHPEWPETLTLSLPPWNHQRLDWLMITTKAGDTLDALLPYASKLHQVDRILLLQNGMGQHEQVAHWLKEQGQSCELWHGISTDGAYRLENNSVIYAGLGDVWIGLPSAQANGLPRQITSHLPHTQVVSDILTRQRQKLAINAVINPLTACYRCLNGALISNPEYRAPLHSLAIEIEQLYQHQGWPLPDQLPERVTQIALSTADNRSSSLQDVLANRPTELDHICGYLLAQASAAKIDLPLTRALMDQLNIRSGLPT
ncbi:ketopantoate reductase family protein [Oceanobacter sp. 4_MG-2023]|uniref:ketopantoate reductase family protein n=1 Tax=Oceanobacter sp. 4_MG-2023 TaxID=3062623 RepID=UPI00273617F4|nr:ketopantoate reductase family protein [Oceanobacter sp. 4_MG-2023]MDP2548546.1 ketopantoate reductase family protein [Oceanobacter sp. 4_MG-2023]